MNATHQEGVYNDIKDDFQYQALDFNRQCDYQDLRQVQSHRSSNLNHQVNYEGLRQMQPRADIYYEPITKTEQIYENQSGY